MKNGGVYFLRFLQIAEDMKSINCYRHAKLYTHNGAEKLDVLQISPCVRVCVRKSVSV